MTTLTLPTWLFLLIAIPFGLSFICNMALAMAIIVFLLTNLGDGRGRR